MKKVIPFTKTITFRTMIAEITDIEVKHTLKLGDDYDLEGDILVDGRYKMTDASQIEEEFHYKLPFTISIDPKYDLENLEVVISDFYFEIINEEDLKINVEIEMDGLEEKKIEKVTNISLDDGKMVELEKLEDSEEVFMREINDEDAEIVPVEVNENVQALEFSDDPLEQLASQIEEDLGIEEKTLVSSPFIKKMETPLVESTSDTTSSNNNSFNSSSMSSIFSQLASSEETFSTYYVYIVRENDTIDSIIDKYQTTKDNLLAYNDLNDIKIGTKLIIPCVTSE